MLINLFVELFSKNKPTLNHFSLYTPLGSNMTLSSEDLIFSVGILDESYQILNYPTIFT